MAKREGQTLIEVVVATVVAAMTATAVFSVVLSAQVSGLKSDKREAAAMIIKAAQEHLKSYVSAQPADPEWSHNAGVWANATPAGVWALAEGQHDVTFLLAGTQFAAGDTLVYTVVNENCLADLGVVYNTENACKQVVFRLTYQE